jgi:hypothetical protein
MKGYAPGWQVRCPRCGLTFDAADLGWVRIWAAGHSYKLLWCSQCHWFRWCTLERKPRDVPDPAGPRSQWDGTRALGPTWRLSCPTCRETFHVRRLGWADRWAPDRCRTLRWCGRCRRLRRFLAERRPAALPELVAPNR